MSPATPRDWSAVLVTAALDEDLPIIRPTVKTAARDYRGHGAFPIVDQSQNAIAGWTDNVAAVLRPSRPVVVFGDHTRAFKYVDFPFATGADGTLVLNPSKEFEPLFFYFVCLGLEIPSRGYNRHYTMLKEMVVPKPPLAEQRKIAAMLGKVQEAVAVEGDLVRVSRELKQVALSQLFTRGMRGEPQKQTVVGLIPDSWDVVPLGEIGRVGNGSTPRRTELGYWGGGTIPWLTSARVYDRVVENAAEFVTPLAVKECHLPRVPPDSLIIAITGQGKTLGHVARVAIETCVSQHVAYITMDRPGVVPDFLRQYLDTRYSHFRQVAMGGGSTKGALTCGFLKSFPVPLASEAEQREITTLLATLDAKIAHHEARQALLRELFRTLLHDLLTGRRRVTNLDLGALEAVP